MFAYVRFRSVEQVLRTTFRKLLVHTCESKIYATSPTTMHVVLKFWHFYPAIYISADFKVISTKIYISFAVISAFARIAQRLHAEMFWLLLVGFCIYSLTIEWSLANMANNDYLEENKLESPARCSHGRIFHYSCKNVSN